MVDLAADQASVGYYLLHFLISTLFLHTECIFLIMVVCAVDCGNEMVWKKYDPIMDIDTNLLGY